MKKQEFLNLIRSKIIFLDGATGTELAKLGMPHGICPEAWVVEHPEQAMIIGKKGKQLVECEFSYYEQSKRALAFINEKIVLS